MTDSIAPQTSKTDRALIRLDKPELVHKTWAATYCKWARGLTREEYYEREIFLSSQEFAKDLTVYALVPSSEASSDNPTLLAHLDAFYRDVIMSDGQGNVSTGRAVGVASIFTNTQYRRQGHASLMMNLLKEQFEKDGVVASNLYSSVGPDFYAQMGWKAYPSLEISAKATKKIPEHTLDALKWIETADLDQIVTDERKRLIEKLKASEVPAVMIDLNVDVLKWHFVQHESYAKVRDKPEIKFRGALIKATGSFVIWAHESGENALVALLSRTEGSDAKMLAAAMHVEANRHGLENVVYWVSQDLSPEKIKEWEEAIGASVAERTDDQSALWLKSGKEYHWLACEKYAWL